MMNARKFSYPFVPRCAASGRLLRLSRSPHSLVYGWNVATDPGRPMTEHEHKRARQYARACWRLVWLARVRVWESKATGQRFVVSDEADLPDARLAEPVC